MSAHQATDELRQLALRWIDLWRPGRLDGFEELHAEDFVDRGAAGRSPTREGFRAGIVELLAAFPDFSPRVDDLVIDEAAQRVAVRWSATGTQHGPFMGAAATNRSIEFRGIEIIRVANNQIVERWGEWDALDLLRQLQGQ